MNQIYLTLNRSKRTTNQNQLQNIMAFNQKIEADRIDDFNLFSAFVRIPLLIIGGIFGVDQSTSTREEIDVCTSANHHQDRNSTGKGDDICDIGIDYSTTRLYQKPQLSNISSNNFGMKRTKRMSWSDENGLPLVLYDEVRIRDIIDSFVLTSNYESYLFPACTIF